MFKLGIHEKMMKESMTWDEVQKQGRMMVKMFGDGERKKLSS